MYAPLFQPPMGLDLLYWVGPEESGHYMTAFMVSMMAVSLVGWLVAEKRECWGPASAGSLLAAGGYARLSNARAGKDALHVVGALVLGGAGWALVERTVVMAAIANVDRGISGLASGVLSTCRYLGGAVGISLLALMLSSPSAAASACPLPPGDPRPFRRAGARCPRRDASPRAARARLTGGRGVVAARFLPSRRAHGVDAVHGRVGPLKRRAGRGRRRQPLAVVEFYVLRAGRDGRCGAAAVSRDRVPRVRLRKAPVAHLDRAPAF